MKILFLVPYLPSVIRARSFNFILDSARRGHSISLISLRNKSEQPSDELIEACDKIITFESSKLRSLMNCAGALISGQSMWEASCKSNVVAKAVADECARTKYDILHVEHLRATSYCKGASTRATVFDSVDCMGPLLRKIADGKRNPIIKAILKVESERVGQREADISAIFDRVIITSQREKDLLLAKSPTTKIDIVPIGTELPQNIDRSSAQLSRIIFTGKMSYFPNTDAVLWFAGEVYPRLIERNPDISLIIAGADPPPAVRALEKIPGITVTGFVKDLGSLLRESGIAVCPLRIVAGAQFKVIEAMANGLPVVASPLAARTVEDCNSVIIADKPDDWVCNIFDLIENPTQAKEIGAKNRKYIEANYSWQAAVDKLEKVYEELLEQSEK